MAWKPNHAIPNTSTSASPNKKWATA